jgi:hypothetical protein
MIVGKQVIARGEHAKNFSLMGVIEADEPDNERVGVRLVNGNFKWFPYGNVMVRAEEPPQGDLKEQADQPGETHG